MLIETTEGVLNTDHVITAQIALGGGGRRSLVLFADGTERTIGLSLHKLDQACGTIVPAPPGFVLIKALLPSGNETGITYTEESVIAFRVGHGGDHDGPMPITVSGEPATASDLRWAVRQPNGQCFGPDTTDETFDAFKAGCEREVSRRPLAA